MRLYIICADKKCSTVSHVVPVTITGSGCEYFKGMFPEYTKGKQFFIEDLELYVNMCTVVRSTGLISLSNIRQFLNDHSANDAQAVVYFEDIGEWYYTESLSEHELVRFT